MSPFFKKILAVSVLLVAIWLILRYFKAEVYNIEIPQNPVIMELVPERILHSTQSQFGVGQMQYKFDSITVSSGLRKGIDSAGNVLIGLEPKHLPLEWLGFWKAGFKITQLVKTADSNHQNESRDKEEKPGIFKENYDGPNLVLRLEKKQPQRIVALWDNYEITGETNGELVKIKVPKCANDFKNSMIRVWCCDKFSASLVCKIPLVNGQVALRFSQMELYETTNPVKNFVLGLYNHFPKMDSMVLNSVEIAMEKVVKDDELKLCLAYGDERFEQMDPTYGMVIYNYYGRKILIVINFKSTILPLSIPVKGDFKYGINGTIFKAKSGKMNFDVPAAGFEIFY